MTYNDIQHIHVGYSRDGNAHTQSCLIKPDFDVDAWAALQAYCPDARKINGGILSIAMTKAAADRDREFNERHGLQPSTYKVHSFEIVPAAIARVGF